MVPILHSFCINMYTCSRVLAHCVDAAMPLLCAVLFLLISFTDSGTQSVNNKNRRQNVINAKLNLLQV